MIDKLRAYAEVYATRGFDDYYGKLRNEGLAWNRKRPGRRAVLRVYRLLNLKHRRRHKRRLPARIKQPLQVLSEPNKSWSMDFVSDALVNKRKIRCWQFWMIAAEKYSQHMQIFQFLLRKYSMFWS